jgi:hypothetical protein
MPKFNIVDASGSQQEIDFDVTAYAAAGDNQMSLSQYLETQYPSSSDGPTTFEQCMAQSGMFVRGDHSSGIHPPTMKAVLEGGLNINAQGIVRNDGSNNNTVTGRLLFPEVIMQIIESELSESKDDLLSGYNDMVATTAFVTSPKVDQPVINVTGPRADEKRSQPIAQLAEPAALVTITLAERSHRIPTKSIGLTISDQALEATTLDLVGIAMTQQANQERIRIVEEAIQDMTAATADVDTDPDGVGLTSFQADTLDPLIVAAGGAAGISFTQKAWVHFLRDNYRTMTVSHIICDIDSALEIENRTGKPTVTTDDPRSPRIDSLFSVDNLGLTAPKILLVDTALIGANTIVGLDSRYAIRRIVNVNAAYSAIENYVMRRATSFRVDYGEISHKLMADAWKKMTLTV